MLEENKELVRRFFNKVMNTGNVNAADDFLVQDTFFFGFMKSFLAERIKGIPDAQTKIEEIFGEDDKITVCTTMTGTNSGSLLGHPPTNKSVIVGAIWVFTIKNGKIISMRFASDMAQQLWLPTSN